MTMMYAGTLAYYSMEPHKFRSTYYWLHCGRAVDFASPARDQWLLNVCELALLCVLVCKRPRLGDQRNSHKAHRGGSAKGAMCTF